MRLKKIKIIKPVPLPKEVYDLYKKYDKFFKTLDLNCLPSGYSYEED